MQEIGYINLKWPYSHNIKKILILVRQAKYGRHLKLRKSGKDGVHFSDEEKFLNMELSFDYTDDVGDLLNGKTIFL